MHIESDNNDVIPTMTAESNQNKNPQSLAAPNSDPNSEMLSRIFDKIMTLPNNTSSEMEKNQSETPQQALPTSQPTPMPPPKRACRAPMSRRFGHPCSCVQNNNHHKFYSSIGIKNGNSTSRMAAPSNPLHLYDPATKKCLPTSRGRDMLLKDCFSPTYYPAKPHDKDLCVHEDLICDTRRFRCTCKPHLHLFYESNHSTFGCVPIGPTSSPDGFFNCGSGRVYNVISKECQKIFDVNELAPNYTTGVSATQFSFVIIVLIWILLLILIVTAKLRKLRTTNPYNRDPSSILPRRAHPHGNPYRHSSRNTSAWLHPFIAAVNGHHHLNQHRTTVDRHSRAMNIDDSGNYNDTDFFLDNGHRRQNNMLNDGNFAGSQLSLNNPPPKFEEIYPSCPADQQPQHQQQLQENELRPPSNEDLPSYDEAMKLQNTMPHDPKE